MHNELNVFFNTGINRRIVGKLAFLNRRYYFEYDKEFINTELCISPFLLPLKSTIYQTNEKDFLNPFGVFNDSIPDGWGMLLLSRKLKQQGVDIRELSHVELLSIVGLDGMGALEYEPTYQIIKPETINESLDVLSTESDNIIKDKESLLLDYMLQNNGSSCGARPKVTQIISDANNKEDYWIIKLLSSMDKKDAGVMEYVYSLAAKKAGIQMPETHLFESKQYPGFFGVRRFDRSNNSKIHMISACGLLNADFRLPSLEYETLLTVTQHLTKDITEVQKMFRMMVFNIKSCNLDDHSKNFSFLMSEDGMWKVSPAYDITYSTGIHGHRMTSVNGKTKDITNTDIISVAKKCGITNVAQIIEEVEASVQEIPIMLKQYGIDFAF